MWRGKGLGGTWRVQGQEGGQERPGWKVTNNLKSLGLTRCSRSSCLKKDSLEIKSKYIAGFLKPNHEDI